MKCKPLCFDYHTEAINLLRKRHKPSTKTRISLCSLEDEPSPCTTATTERKEDVEMVKKVSSSNMDVDPPSGSPLDPAHTLADTTTDPMKVDPCDTVIQTKSARSIRTKRNVTPKYRQAMDPPSSSLPNNALLLPPSRRVSIYDSPFLIQILSSIRRRVNCKRIANHSFESPFCIKVHRILHPSNNNWRTIVSLFLFQRTCIVSSKTAIANVDRIIHIPKKVHLPSTTQDDKASPCGSPAGVVYQYCLLDLLQDRAGTFLQQPLGSKNNRKETRKRELKAIIRYPTTTNILHEMQRRYFLLACVIFDMLQHHQQSSSIRETKVHKAKSLLEKRKSLDAMELKQAKVQKPNQRVDARCTTKRPVASPNSDTVATRASKKSRMTPPLDPIASTNGIARTADENKESKAKAKELSLLARFGLAPQAGQPMLDNKPPCKPRNSIRRITSQVKKRTKQSWPEIVAPPLRCASPSSLDLTLKTRSRELAKEREERQQQQQGRLDGNTSICHTAQMASSVQSLHDPVLALDSDSSSSPSSLNLADERESQQQDGRGGNTSYYKNPQMPSSLQSLQDSVLALDSDSSSIQYTKPILDTPTATQHRANSSEIQSLGASSQFSIGYRSLTATSISQSPRLPQAEDMKHGRFIPSKNQRAEKSRKERKQERKLAKKMRKAKKKQKKEAKKRQEYQAKRLQSTTAFKTSSSIPVDQSVKTKDASLSRLLANKEDRRNQSLASNTPRSVQATEETRATANQKVSSNAAFDESVDDGVDPLVLLCSESFLETWGEAAGKLIAGDWVSGRHPTGDTLGIGGSRKISLFDTSLIDLSGVDIETPNRGGIVVSSLSTWRNDEFPSLVKRVVDLISTSKYKFLDVFVCADIDQDDVAENQIVTLQNAALHQSNTTVSISIVSPRSLATSIGYSVHMIQCSQKLEEIEAWLSDDRTFERIRFLLCTIPTFTATSILFCLLSTSLTKGSQNDRSRPWFQSLFNENDSERRWLQAIDSRSVHPAVSTQLSFALRVNLGA
eukprot:scaffold368_cov125-Cylindrotheca_fusiformis.AAC.7